MIRVLYAQPCTVDESNCSTKSLQMHLTIRLYNFHEPSNIWTCIVQITNDSVFSNARYSIKSKLTLFQVLQVPILRSGAVDLSPFYQDCHLNVTSSNIATIFTILPLLPCQFSPISHFDGKSFHVVNSGVSSLLTRSKLSGGCVRCALHGFSSATEK